MRSVAVRRSAHALRACALGLLAALLGSLLDDLGFTLPRSQMVAALTGVSTASAAWGSSGTSGARTQPPRTSRHVGLPGFEESAGGLMDTSLMTAFSDQAGNINGTLFQGSLPAYLLFLYFLGFRGNNTPPLVYFGFTFLLAFVILTIPAGVISKSTYGLILADSDWVHGSAESLLTCTNIMIVLGFRGALTNDPKLADNQAVRNVAFAWMALVILTLALGIPVFGFQAHTPFLGGLGALPDYVEPDNALSIPNWVVHWSTVFEFLLAMTLAWRYADATGNPKWKGLTWGMLPSSISSVCALTFHVFYNQIPWILTGQALFTFLGNTTLALASYRIAVSNGWTVSELDPRPAFAKLTGAQSEKSEGSDALGSEGSESEAFDITKVTPAGEGELTSGPLLVAEIVLLTLAFAYGTKYGELMFGFFQSPDSSLQAAAVIALPVLLVAYVIYTQSSDLQRGELPPLALAPAAAGEK